jgi:hypothetical protein
MSNGERPTWNEARAEWENVLANQYYRDVDGYSWEMSEDMWWRCFDEKPASHPDGTTLSPDKMRLKVWKETCGIPAGVPAEGRKKFYVEWDENEPSIRVWTEDSVEEPLTLAQAKKEATETLQYQVDWLREQMRSIRQLKVKDIEE